MVTVSDSVSVRVERHRRVGDSISVTDSVNYKKWRADPPGNDFPPEPPQAPKISLGRLRDLYLDNINDMSNIMGRGAHEVIKEAVELAGRLIMGLLYRKPDSLNRE